MVSCNLDSQILYSFMHCVGRVCKEGNICNYAARDWVWGASEEREMQSPVFHLRSCGCTWLPTFPVPGNLQAPSETCVEEDSSRGLEAMVPRIRELSSGHRQQSRGWAGSRSPAGSWADGFLWKLPQTSLQVSSLSLAHPDKCPLSFVSEGRQRGSKDRHWQNSWCLCLQNWRRIYLVTEPGS